MAKTKVSEFDSTAANNTDIDSINIAEGCAPSGINNALRSMMSILKTEFFKTGSNNTSLGDGALDSLDGSSPGDSNVAIGKDAGTALTTGDRNVAVGHNAFDSATNQEDNVAVGHNALSSITASGGTLCTAIGSKALESLTTGFHSVAVGYGSQDAMISGIRNVSVGRDSLGADTKGSYNTAIGDLALSTQNFTSATDAYNTAVGADAGKLITTGDKNVVLGSYTGNQGGLDIRTSSNNVVISDGDGNVRLYSDSVGRIGIGNISPSTYSGRIVSQISGGASAPAIACVNSTVGGTLRMIDFFQGTSTSRVGSIESNSSSTAYNTSSDYRLKENVTDISDGITRVKQLSPKRFNFIVDADTTVDGFLAHEAATVVPESVSGTKDAMMDEEYTVTAAKGDVYTPATDDADEIVHSSNVEQPDTLADGQAWRETAEAVMGTRSVPDMQGIDQSKLVPLLTAALQEAIAKIEALETRVAALEG